ncbi:hypothetical protein MMC26_003094 [Xylographa opegraphella]|nr:hypothetical protein [Xylographa opegraphella]
MLPLQSPQAQRLPLQPIPPATPPPPPPAPPSSNEPNCYADLSGTRPIDGPNDFSTTSIEDCATFCYNSSTTGPYTYFGIEYSYQCFCRNALDVRQRLSPHCTLPCSGAATEHPTRGLTTVPTAPPYVHLACYVDNLYGRLLSAAEDDSTGSIELCASYCLGAAGGPYAYFGMEYYSQCFCGNAYNASAPVSTGCSFPCSGDGAEICGGSDAVDIYYNTQLVATPPPQPTPT